jgi:hypothetical protein
MQELKKKLKNIVDFINSDDGYSLPFENKKTTIHDLVKDLLAGISIFHLFDKFLDDFDLLINKLKQSTIKYIKSNNLDEYAYCFDLEILLQLINHNWQHSFEKLSQVPNDHTIGNDLFFFFRSLIPIEYNIYRLEDALIAFNLNPSERNYYNASIKLCESSDSLHNRLGILYLKKLGKINKYTSPEVSMSMIKYKVFVPGINLVDKLIELHPYYISGYYYGSIYYFEGGDGLGYGKYINDAERIALAGIKNAPSHYSFLLLLAKIYIVKSIYFSSATLIALKYLKQYSEKLSHNSEIEKLHFFCRQITNNHENEKKKNSLIKEASDKFKLNEFQDSLRLFKQAFKIKTKHITWEKSYSDFKLIEYPIDNKSAMNYEDLEIYYTIQLKLLRSDIDIDDSQQYNKNHYTIYSSDSIVEFGKFDGKSIKEIIHEQPDYLLWCILNLDHFVLEEDLLSELHIGDGVDIRKAKIKNYLKLLYQVKSSLWKNECCSKNSFTGHENFTNEDAFDSPEQYRDFLASR